jgi:hypothetical protein
MNAECDAAQYPANTNITFHTIPNDSFGSGIGFTGGDSILLQPGFYLVHLSAVQIDISTINSAGVHMFVPLNGGDAVFSSISWALILSPTPSFVSASIAGDRLVHVLAPNTTIQFQTRSLLGINGCELVIMQVQ